MSDSSQKRRETIMQQRLRKARGEEVEEEMEEAWHEDQAPPAAVRGRMGAPPLPAVHPYGGSNSGCLYGGLYVIVGALAVLALFLLLETNFSSTIDLFSRFASGVPWPGTSPTPTLITSATVVERVQRVQRIETTSYAVQTVIEGKVAGDELQNLLWGDRILLVAHGTVVAGLDLATLQPEDVQVSEDGRAVTIRLPPVQVFHSVLNNELTQVYDREQGLLADPGKDLETSARQFAEAKILETACQGGVMEQATSDGQQAIEQLLSMLDFEQIAVVPAEVPPCPEAPLTAPQ